MGYDYQYWLASMLMDRMDTADGDLADFLHSHTGYKFYTFSNLKLEDHRNSNSGLQFNNAHFFLTSPDKKFIEGFASGLLQEPEFELGHTEFMVKSIEILDSIHVPEKCTMKTLSPIYVKTKRKIDGELKEWDLYAEDGKFYENLHKNLVNRYKEYYGEEPEKNHFEVKNVHRFKGRRYTIAGDHRRCNEMKFDVEGSRELLEFGYEAGFGEKNAMGFGCVEVVE
ncbi:MAG: CRISPR-associated endoribonuclease Cas6 [Candidatus Saliniplasma sp.]